MLNIRTANEDEYQAVRALYHSMIRAMQKAEYTSGWEIDIYPAPEYLQEVISKKEMYVGEIDGELVAAMVVNHDFNESYNVFDWPTEAAADEITVIHALGVHPDYFHRGIAKQLVRKAVAIARENNQKVIRLDVLAGNLPAERLYEAEGFRHLHTLPMFYEDTGWTDYELYELVL